MTKSKATAQAVGPNFAALTFPTDTDGLTARLRHEFRDAVLRCRGSEQKFQLVQDTLDLLAAWAQAKLADDRADLGAALAEAAARDELEARREAFRARIQTGPAVKVSATATGFVEIDPQDGTIRATYDTADDPRGPVQAMACMMLAAGRSPTAALQIDAFGRPGVGSGQTLGELAGTADAAPGSTAQARGLIAIPL